jgi:hypothetical protein
MHRHSHHHPHDHPHHHHAHGTAQARMKLKRSGVLEEAYTPRMDELFRNESYVQRCP